MYIDYNKKSKVFIVERMTDEERNKLEQLLNLKNIKYRALSNMIIIREDDFIELIPIICPEFIFLIRLVKLRKIYKILKLIGIIALIAILINILIIL